MTILEEFIDYIVYSTSLIVGEAGQTHQFIKQYGQGRLFSREDEHINIQNSVSWAAKSEKHCTISF